MKKVFLSLLIGLMMIQVSGCAKTEEEQPTPAAETQEKISENDTEEETVVPEEVPEAEASEEASESEAEVQKEVPSYYGAWKITAAEPSVVSDPSVVCALSMDEINALIGSSLFYSEDTFRFNEEERAISGYEYENIAYTEEAFVEDYRLNLGEWWNEKPQVMYFALSSEDNFFGRQFFVADEETLWIPYEGAVFMAKRAEK